MPGAGNARPGRITGRLQCSNDGDDMKGRCAHGYEGTYQWRDRSGIMLCAGLRDAAV
jgi:hypothetical protein